ITGRSTSKAAFPGEKRSSADAAPASTRHHASAVCASPRYHLSRKLGAGRLCGTAQYAMDCCFGSHTHLSAIVRMGRETLVEVALTRTKRVSAPLEAP